MKELADDNFKFDENGRQFSKQVGNTVGKRDIARKEHFFPFPTVLSKDLSFRHQKSRASFGKCKRFLSDPSCEKGPYWNSSMKT